jgi:preprotein translocase subunit SecG
MTYASEMFGWYAGDIEADTYFCPERQGDYFGGFYMKDAPAMGNQGYTIDESVTGHKGAAFLTALDASQRSIITSIVNTQRAAINGIVETRRAIAAELRKALTSGTVDEEKVISLGGEYGKLDGEISYYYATAFAEVGKTLTTAQKSKLMEIRNLDNYPTQEGTIYLYSEIINQPSIPNTDFLFINGNSKNSTPTPTPILESTCSPVPSPSSTASASSGTGLNEFSVSQLGENQFVLYTILLAATFIIISVIIIILRKKNSSIKPKGVTEEQMKRTQTKNMIYHKLSSKIENKKTYAAIKEQDWK